MFCFYLDKIITPIYSNYPFPLSSSILDTILGLGQVHFLPMRNLLRRNIGRCLSTALSEDLVLDGVDGMMK